MCCNDPQAITYLLRSLKILMSNLKHFKLTLCYSQELSHKLEVPKEIEDRISQQQQLQPLSLTIIITIITTIIVTTIIIITQLHLIYYFQISITPRYGVVVMGVLVLVIEVDQIYLVEVEMIQTEE